ncbi:nucleotide disphospho-sugar-binding domain-containing protein [Sinomonas albida]|uniref:nucleotide disphospho-sugar-binding domain-containing protein n=1 Tax=Sinomonas albida TaxID=369942 RepID=UPI0010A8FC68|nr:nucleotide disphospho-sugar-binding domain-containing protein [Sinomonas albida]
MRVLFVSTPGLGHLFPMVPLAWALRARGHTILVATASDALDGAASAGLSAVDASPGFDRRALIARLREEQPELVKKRLQMRLTSLEEASGFFARMTERLVDGVVDAAQRWRPDVIVQSQVQGAGLVAAGRLGLPLVEHGFGFARTPNISQKIFEKATGAFERHGVSALPESATIDVAPASMIDGHPSGWPMRYVPYNGGRVLPDWLLEPERRPRIAVTLGTIAPDFGGVDPIRRLIELAPSVPAEFVLATGSADLSGLGTLPPNVRAAGWVPLNELLPSCAGIIHHGGAGTTLTAAACGTPQLVMPSGADRHINAAAVERRGVGISLEPEVPVTAEILHRLLDDPGLMRTAAEVRAEIAAMPAPAEVAEHVERLV